MKRQDLVKGHSAFPVGQRPENGMRLGLIPISRRSDIITAMIIVSMLNRYFNAPVKQDRIRHMIPVYRDLTAPIGAPAKNDTVIGRAYLLLGTPGRIEIILGAGAMDPWRSVLPIYEYHVVAFPVPIPFVGKPQIMDV